jgi:hypothetical protein
MGDMRNAYVESLKERTTWKGLEDFKMYLKQAG